MIPRGEFRTIGDTPSFFVPKARGDETRYGDYFVSYLFLLSRETGPQPEVVGRDGTVKSWRELGIFLDAAEWRTYRGGSYDGFEEIGITLFGTIGEMLLIGLVIFLVSLRAAWKGRNLDQAD